LQVRPTADKLKGAATSSGATKEQVAAEVNKAKAANKRHQRYKSKQKTGDQEPEVAKKTAGGQERAGKTQQKPKSNTGDSKRKAGAGDTKKSEKKKTRESGGSGANDKPATS